MNEIKDYITYLTNIKETLGLECAIDSDNPNDTHDKMDKEIMGNIDKGMYTMEEVLRVTCKVQ